MWYSLVASAKDVAVVVGVIGVIVAIIFAGRQAFGALSNLKFPEIELPTINLPDINFPEITFPDFPDFPEIVFPEFPDFSNIFESFQKQIEDISNQVFNLGEAVGMFGEGTTITEEGIIEGETPPTIDSTTGQGTDISTLFGELRPQVFDTLISLGIDPTRAADILSGATTIEDLGVILDQANTGIFSRVEPEPEPEPIPVSSFLDDQEFFGGGVGFIGGQILPAGTGLSQQNIAELSLSEIIDLGLAMSASEAASIRAEAIGFTEEEQRFLDTGVF